MITIGSATIIYNRQARQWQVTKTDVPAQPFGTGAVGRQQALRFAIQQEFPAVGTAVTTLCQKYEPATSRAWAAAHLLTTGHVLVAGRDAEAYHVARVVSQQEGRPQRHYYIALLDSRLTCTCPDYEAGGVVIGNQSLCKHSLAFLLARYLEWPLAEGQPAAAAHCHREWGGRWHGRTAIRVNNTTAPPSNGYRIPGTPPRYGDGDPVPPPHQAAYSAYVSAVGQVPFNSEKLMSWYIGR
jgi:hypothetical protein